MVQISGEELQFFYKYIYPFLPKSLLEQNITWMDKEEIARRWCSKKHSITLEKDKVMLGHYDDGSPILFEFDIASPSKLFGIGHDDVDERDVVGMVKSTKRDSAGVEFQPILGDCFLLNKAMAHKKYMILTEKDTFDYFKKRVDTLLDEIELVYLDTNIHKELLDNF